jgi:predicted PilT family ATPase
MHVKENVPILKKKGSPGNRRPVVEKNIFPKSDVNKLIDDVYREIEARDDGFLEIDRKLSKVVQL